MPKRLTVFYSWQSDTPSKLNRNFIEEALHEALKRLHSDATLEVALRDITVELDKDTKGVAGSPPIAETILGKIEACTAFVADLTFVGEAKQALVKPGESPRLFPNPNVLIEHGYALNCRGHTALIGVMNTAYGQPEKENLPFDLRHLRWPITYHLAESSDPEKRHQFEKLTTTLVEALRLILANHSPAKTSPPDFIPRNATANAAVFWDEDSNLVPSGPFGEEVTSFVVPHGGKAYLRVCPSVARPSIASEIEARKLAISGHLRPMGLVRGISVSLNEFGAIAYDAPLDQQLLHFTQLFLNGEIWGVDATCVNSQVRNLRKEKDGPPKGYILIDYVERYFAEALENYLSFAKNILKMTLPLRIEAGLFGVKGYPIAFDQKVRGKALHDFVQWQGRVESYETEAQSTLAPFYDLIWTKCGLERPPKPQSE